MRNTIHVPHNRKKHFLSVLTLYCIGLFICAGLLVSPSYGQHEATVNDVPHVISYQGVLTNTAGQSVADGKYSVTATLYSDAQGTGYVWQDKYDVNVKGGVFSVLLGSGSSHLPRLITIDQPLWVGVAIGNQPELRPLTALTSVPYALNVADNSITAKKMATDFVGSITVDNAPINVKGHILDLKSGSGIDLNFDKTSNSLSFNLSNSQTAKGTGEHPQMFLGPVPPCTVDNVPPTDAVGYPSNSTIGVAGGIGYVSMLGGWGNAATGDYSTLGGGAENKATGCGSVVVGGGIIPNNCVMPPPCGVFGAFNGNAAVGISSFIGGGASNVANADLDAILGGQGNVTNSNWNSIGGGRSNTTNGNLSTIGGGDSNVTLNHWNTIGGGHTNITDGKYATIGGGDSNKTNNDWATVGGGYGNIAGGGAGFLWTQTVGGGDHNYAWGDGATVAGGEDNKAWSMHDFIGGGRDNATILQAFPCVMGTHNVICGGLGNRANGQFSMIPGGLQGQTRDYGQLAHASGSFPGGLVGSAQTSVFVLRNTTSTAAGFTSLFLDGGTQRITVPANGAMAVHVLIIGKTAGCAAGGSVTGGWELTFTALDACGGGVLIGGVNITPLNPIPAGWAVAIAAAAPNPPIGMCNTQGTIDIRVTSAGTVGNVEWVASARTSEVVF